MPAARSLAASTITIAIIAGVVATGSQPREEARADSTADEPASEPAPPPAFETPVIGPQGAARFSLAPSGGADAVAFDDLSDLEKESTAAAASILSAAQPPESVAGWSAISRQAAERAAARRAEYESGTSGMSDLGVE